MIRLEFLEREDFYKIVDWNKDTNRDFLYQWAGPWYQYPLTEKQIEDRIINNANKTDSDILVFKIILAETNEMIGIIELFKIDRIVGTAVAGKFLIGDERQRGRGLGKQILKELLRIGFDELGLNTIGINVFDFNIGATKCYESVGFGKKNFIEKVYKSENGFWNLYEMSIYKDDVNWE
jgi:RimJ/RimL family protein N-acetyltransferase